MCGDGDASSALFTTRWLTEFEAMLASIRVDKFLPLFPQLLVRLTTANTTSGGVSQVPNHQTAFQTILRKVSLLRQYFTYYRYVIRLLLSLILKKYLVPYVQAQSKLTGNCNHKDTALINNNSNNKRGWTTTQWGKSTPEKNVSK